MGVLTPDPEAVGGHSVERRSYYPYTVGTTAVRPWPKPVQGGMAGVLALQRRAQRCHRIEMPAKGCDPGCCWGIGPFGCALETGQQ